LESCRLYLDEDVNPNLARLLRERGVDATCAREEDQLGKSDEEQLAFATERDRAIVTHNVGHFVELAREYAAQGRSHAGIILSAQLGLGELIRRLLRMRASINAPDPRDQVVWLSRFAR
jgi:predicted nuclease of predicted toxin-antitoxin system